MGSFAYHVSGAQLEIRKGRDCFGGLGAKPPALANFAFFLQI